MSLASKNKSAKIAPIFKIGKKPVVKRVPEILRICADKKILHLGCADMPYTEQRGKELLHSKLSEVTKKEYLWGLDISEKGVDMLHNMGFRNILHGNVETAHNQLSQQQFDIVLAGEIIEHVSNVGSFLQSLQPIMGATTELLLTTVNANSFKGFIHSILRREKVHPDHNYYFSYRTLFQLLSKFNYTCEEIYYYQEIRDRGVVSIIDNFLAIPTRFSSPLSDGLIVRAKHQSVSSSTILTPSELGT